MATERLFSVVIPVYNCPAKLERALRSLAEQTSKDFEVIICDSSEPRLEGLATRHAGSLPIKYIWEEDHGSPAHARNSAIQLAEGQYIAFLDSDDWWYPDKLGVVARRLTQADVIYHDLDIYTSGGKKRFKKIRGRKLNHPVFIDLMRNANALITSGVVIRKEVIEKTGGFVEGNLLEDFDLWLRVAMITERFLYLPRSLGAYSLGAGTRSSASIRMAKMLETVYKKNFVFLAPRDRQQAKAVMCYLQGRTYQRIGRLEEAMRLFKISSHSENLKFKLRSACWLVLLTVLPQMSKNSKDAG